MIFVSDAILEIGQAYIPPVMSGLDGKFIKPQPVYVKRVTTREEYIKQGLDLRALIIFPECKYFYEVSMD